MDIADLAQRLERVPAIAQSCQRLVEASCDPHDLPGMVAAVESDVVLALATLRSANRRPNRGTVATIPEAVRTCGPARLAALVERMPTADLLNPAGDQRSREILRLHALAVHRAMDRLARLLGRPDHERLLCAALLHDLGKLALLEADPDYARTLVGDGRPPAERLQAEREQFGVDHAVVGGRLAEHCGLPSDLADPIAGHHDDGPGDAALLVRLADKLAHYAEGHAVDVEALAALAGAAGLTREQLASLLYALPHPLTSARPSMYPCPLSTREVEVLQRLADGKVYKQIASDLGLSASTVRSHLHRIYTRIGAADRTHAVLLASEHGWI